MKRITAEQQEKMLETNTQIKNELSDIINQLENLCKKADSYEVSSSYTNAIYDHISEAETRVKMANIRCSELEVEIKSGELFESFY